MSNRFFFWSLVLFGLVLLLVMLSLSGCVEKSGMASGDVVGTLKSVELKVSDEIEVVFYNGTIGIFTFYRYTDDGRTDWYKILRNGYIDKNIRLVWLASYDRILIVSMEEV